MKPAKKTTAQKRAERAALEKLCREHTETIDMTTLVKESAILGTNARGQTVYGNRRGVFVVDHSRQEYEPFGYPNFGGDLAPVAPGAEPSGNAREEI